MTIFVSNVYKFEYNAESDDNDEEEDNGDNVGDDNGVTTR